MKTATEAQGTALNRFTWRFCIGLAIWTLGAWWTYGGLVQASAARDWSTVVWSAGLSAVYVWILASAIHKLWTGRRAAWGWPL